MGIFVTVDLYAQSQGKWDIQNCEERIY